MRYAYWRPTLADICKYPMEKRSEGEKTAFGQLLSCLKAALILL